MSWGVPSWILNKNRPFWSLVWSPVSRHVFRRVCRRLATINISKPLQNLLCVHPEPLGHEEVDEGVVCCGCLAEQGGNDPVFWRYLLKTGKMTPLLHGTNTTWGWVTISHTQSPAKGPQAMINPAAVVAISWGRKLVWLVLLILINSNPGQLLVYHCYCLLHAVHLYTSTIRLFIFCSMARGSHLKYLKF